jgi:ankyrin repeat protein
LTALHYATSQASYRVAELFLQEGKADIDANDDNGWTPLHLASYMGYRAVVRMLIAHNADIE